MTSVEFTQHIRFALHHLFETSVLDKGPALALAPWLDEVYSPDTRLSPGQRLHQALVQGIEQMKPTEPLDINLPHHRNYLILKRRYIDSISIPKLETEFNTSSRQLRRESHRALEELVLLLWNLAPGKDLVPNESSSADDIPRYRNSLADFSRSINLINLLDLVVDSAQTLSVIISNTHTQLTADIPADLPPVTADRIALRLAMIKLLREAISHSPAHILTLHAVDQSGSILLQLDGIAGISAASTSFIEAAQLFRLAEGNLSLQDASADQSDQHLVIHLSTSHRPTVMVIDDDPAMARIIQRFLALKPIKVISCDSTVDIVKMAREAQPILILLDVLMPKRDGWDVLQELKAHPDTYQMNLAVCSIWDERDLAMSLGADLFFQKPINREELLQCVEQNLN